MDDLTLQYEQQPMRMVSGALAQLARHMETGCPRAASLAAVLLERVSRDPGADAHLREHARELVEILERDPVSERASVVTPAAQTVSLTGMLFMNAPMKAVA